MVDSAGGVKSWLGFQVLVVSPTPTHPQDHGNRKRIYEICTALKGFGAAIHFVHYPSEHDWRHAWPTKHEEEMRAAWDTYQLVAPGRPLHADAIYRDHEIDEWADPGLEHFITWAFHVRTYDLVIVNYTWMSFCFRAVPKSVFKLCDTHDVFGGRRQMLEANGLAAEFFHTSTEDEARGLARADLVWAIKESEQTYFETELKLPSCLTMLHAEPERGWWTGPPSTDGWLRAGVIGARNNVNRRNLEQFLEHALPAFERYMAPVKIVIAGGCADDFKDWRHPNLEILGRVPEVEQFYRGVDVVIAPMQFSTGLKIKVSEALASGAPLVAHAHAMEGYPTTEPLHLLRDFDEMALELIKLSFEPAPLGELARRSRSVCAAVQTTVDKTFEATRRRLVAKFASMICVIIPMEALNPASLLHDHLLATLDYIRFTASLAIYVVGVPTELASGILERFDIPNQIYADPGLMVRLGDKAPEAWTSIELADFLEVRGYERAYVMADCCAGLQFGTGALRNVFIRHDAIELAGGDADAVVNFFRASTEVCVIGSVPSAVFSWRGKSGVADVVHAPFRRTGVFESFARRASPVGAGTGLFILANHADPVAIGLVELAARIGLNPIILDPRAPAIVEALVRPVGLSAAHDPIAHFSSARLVVDMTTMSALATVIGEAAMRLSIPRLALQRGATAVALHPFPSVLHPTSIARLYATVAECAAKGDALDALRGAAGREATARFLADAGWTVLWGLLKKSNVAGVGKLDDAAKDLWG